MAPNSNLWRNFTRNIKSLLKKAVAVAKCSNRAILIVWHDPTGTRHWGTSELSKKFKECQNCVACGGRPESDENVWDRYLTGTLDCSFKIHKFLLSVIVKIKKITTLYT